MRFETISDFFPDWQMAVQFGLWSIFGIVWLVMWGRTRRQRDPEAFVSESNYNGTLYLTLPISLVIWKSGLGQWEANPSWLKNLGLIISAVGLGLAVVARFVLGHYWAFHAAGHREGEFLETFPYNLVRHPIYGGQLLLCLGTSLSSGNVGVLLVLTGGTYLLQLQRARREEAMLDRLTGGAYGKRFRAKGRFLPRLLPRRSG